MSAFTSRPPAGGRLLVALVVLAAGCSPRAAAPGTVAARAPRAASAEPGEIELSDPRVTFTEPNRVQFEVRYKFTKGQPDKYYLCEIFFPGTPNHGAKPMDSWELQSEGVIKDRLELTKPPVQT